MSGLNAEQLDELEECVEELLEEPWDKGKGRPRELTFREALIVACGYARNNITEEVWAEIFDVGQSTISRYITFLTPLIDQATAGFRPPAGEAAEANPKVKKGAVPGARGDSDPTASLPSPTSNSRNCTSRQGRIGKPARLLWLDAGTCAYTANLRGIAEL